MLKYIINIWFKNKLRDINLQKNVLIILLAIFVASIYISNNKETLIYFYKYLSNLDIVALIQYKFYIIVIVDFIIKIIFKKEVLIIPDYIKTKNISKRAWEQFVILYNILDFYNLYHCILIFPVLYTFTKSNIAILIIISIYLVSLLISLFLSIIRKTDNIQTKIYFSVSGIGYILIIYLLSVTSMGVAKYFAILTFITIVIYSKLYKYFSKIKKYNENRNSITRKKNISKITLFSIEYTSILRSKRLIQLLSFTSILLLIGIYLYRSSPLIYLMYYFYMSIPILSLGQFILGIEANYFCGIWTKPYHLKTILENKYKFYILLDFIYLVILIPFIVLTEPNVLNVLSLFIYIAGFVNISFFPFCLFTNRIDLNSSTFMNNQGNSPFIFIFGMLIFTFTLWLYNYIVSTLDYWIANFSLFLIGILSYSLRNFIFSAIYYLFKTNRYKIMERFRTK